MRGLVGDWGGWGGWGGWWASIPLAIRKGLAVLAKYGSEAHLFIPGVGRVSGIDALNFVESTFVTPASANDPIGGVKNSSGGTINITQATTANKPMLGIEPMGGRRNLLQNSAFAGAVSGTPGTAPPGWFFNASGGTSTVGTESITMSASASQFILAYEHAVAEGETLTFHCNIDSNVNIKVAEVMYVVANVTAQQFYIDGVAASAATKIIGKHHVSSVVTTSAGTSVFRLGIGCVDTATGTVTFSKPQLERGDVVTAYQRTFSAYEAYEDGKDSIYYWQKGASAGWLGGAPLFDGTVRDYYVGAAFRIDTADITGAHYFFIPAITSGGTTYKGLVYVETGVATIRDTDGTTALTASLDAVVPGGLYTVSAIRSEDTLTPKTNGVSKTPVTAAGQVAITPINSFALASISGASPAYGKLCATCAVQATITAEEQTTLDTMLDYISGRVR